jgi:hypothetical protein
VNPSGRIECRSGSQIMNGAVRWIPVSCEV